MANPNERPWWQSPWTCGIGGCCLGCVALPLLIVTILGGGAFFLARSAGVYQEALAMVKEDPRAIELLGEPIETGWQFNGNIQAGDRGGEAEFSVPISGPKGSGMLEVEAKKVAGEWQYEQIRIVPDDGGVPLDLVGGPRILEVPASPGDSL
ncbi:MAG: hypothetical protein KDD47_26850 [Acidobacteria bacterium]|nr:hypothetical protein [Acidobacteriota bacterium]